MFAIKFIALVAWSAVPVAAFWRLPCASPVVVERADPIVDPGAVSGHLHTIMGGNAFDFTMDYQKTQTSDCTSCQVHGDLSNYWTPTLYYKHQNGTFEQVEQNGGMLVYYLQRKGQDSEKLLAFPEGFRMVAGDPYKRSGGDDFASQAISYNCLDYSGQTHHDETGAFPNYNCPNGLRSQVFFPACWDGKNLDSDDHKSHVAYPTTAYNNGACPDSHPVHLISIFYEIIWETDKFADMWYGNSQPFVWSMGDPTGYGLHGDFLNGWDVNLLQRAVDGCTNDSGRVEDCHEFNLYSAQEAGQCKKPSAITEPLNFIDALPGCNPISSGPEPAKKVTNCTNTPDVGAGGGSSNSYPGTTSPSDSHVSNSPIATGYPTTLATSSIRPGGTSASKTTTYNGAQHTSKMSTYGQQAAGTTSTPGGAYYPSSLSEQPDSSSATTSSHSIGETVPTTTTAAAAIATTAATSTPTPAKSGICKHKLKRSTLPSPRAMDETITNEVTPGMMHRRHINHLDKHRVHHLRSGRMGPAYR